MIWDWKKTGLLLTVLGGVAAFVFVGCEDDNSPSTPGVENDCGTSDPGPAGEFLYVGNAGDNTVSVINPRTCKVIATIPVGTDPGEMNPSENGRYVFVANGGSNDVSVIDTQTNTVTKTIAVQTRPVHMFWSPDYTRLWVRNDGSASVSVIDLSSLTVVATIPTGAGHGKMAFTDGNPYMVYVSNISDGTLTVINGVTLQVVTTVTVGPGPHGMDYSSHSKKVYNCSGGTPPGIDVVATEGASANTVVTRIPLTTRCGYIHTGLDPRYLFATSGGANQLIVIDAQTDAIVGTVATGVSPDKIGFFHDDVAVVTNVKSNFATMVNTSTLQRFADVTIGFGFVDPVSQSGHRSIAESLDEHYAYIPNGADNTISIVATDDREVRSTISVGMEPAGLAVAGPTGGKPYPR